MEVIITIELGVIIAILTGIYYNLRNTHSVLEKHSPQPKELADQPIRKQRIPKVEFLEAETIEEAEEREKIEELPTRIRMEILKENGNR